MENTIFKAGFESWSHYWKPKLQYHRHVSKPLNPSFLIYQLGMISSKSRKYQSTVTIRVQIINVKCQEQCLHWMNSYCYFYKYLFCSSTCWHKHGRGRRKPAGIKNLFRPGWCGSVVALISTTLILSLCLKYILSILLRFKDGFRHGDVYEKLWRFFSGGL